MNLFVQPCSCKALIRPKWTRDEPRVFVCQRCGKPVPGYEQMYLERIKFLEKAKKQQG